MIFLKPVKYDGYGHLAISMCHHGTVTQVYVHRLVAEMFIPNPCNLPVVRHLDDNPTNNVVWNLAWGTQRNNWEDAVRHGTAHSFSDEDCKKALEKRLAVLSQPVIAISESDRSEIPFPSIRDAARELNLWESNVRACLNGRQKQTGGYSFVRAELVHRN